jgi:trehalose-phosphatase
MHVLDAAMDPEQFLTDLTEAPARALMLDYDGTIAPFQVNRDRAVPYPEVVQILNEMMQSQHSRLVLVTGRAISDLLPLIDDIRPLPEIWGSHGWERREITGQLRPVMLPAEVLRALASARQGAEAGGFLERCEIKPISIALHWRGLDETAQGELRDRALLCWEPILDSLAPGELEMQAFDGGLELKATGRNKGDAVKSVLSDLPPSAAIAYLGDDRTDEDAFKVLKPRGLCVLVRSELRPTLAHAWLKPPQELVEFLTQWHRISTKKR